MDPGQGPQFDRHRYERPNQKWVCGHAREGVSCRLGPTANGHCRGGFECKPHLETKPGESKGHYRCTRPPEFGGPCETGPLPDGTCARAVPKCQPVQTLRTLRGKCSFAVIAATVALLLIVLGSSARLRFINPGPISPAHSSERFGMLLKTGRSKSGCEECHASAALSMAGWLNGAFRGEYRVWQIEQLATPGPPARHRVDQACLRCHSDHGFHHEKVAQNHSCSACHREHRGDELARDPGDAACARCHNDPASLRRAEAAAPFAAFHMGHPEFAVHDRGMKDKNALRFNHARHFAEDIPAVNGAKLDCATCHEPGPTGGAYAPVSFEKHCQSCHSLQFDRRNPDVVVPHGNAADVRAFVHSLPVQFTDLARRKGMVREREISEFVRAQLAALRDEAKSEENLERQIFFGETPGSEAGSGFRSCSLCHQLNRSAADLPEIARPFGARHWLPRGEFDHARHTSVTCRHCHDATRSRETSDILLPSVAVCVSCHSPAGGFRHNCTMCHNFHRPGQP